MADWVAQRMVAKKGRKMNLRRSHSPPLQREKRHGWAYVWIQRVLLSMGKRRWR